MIGRGGMADVYIGRHTTLDRPMAVKVLHAHMTADPELRRRFEDEAKAVSGLRHPNIVQVLDFDVVDERPYIIMELLEGMSLGQFLRELHSIGHTLPLETIVRLISGIAAALDYAHQRGIVHRDVKPANIVLRKGRDPLRAGQPLGEDVQPILTDFGVARIASASTRTASGTVLGTPAYMSPEQVQGLVVDARSDIYSLGIIVYEMLAGRLPFDPDTDTPASILYKHVHESPPRLANIPDNVREVVDRALAKNKEDRYQQPGAFARDLQVAVASPGPATPSGPTLEAELPPSAAETAVSTGTPQPTATPQPAAADSTPASMPPTISSGGGGLSGIALVGAFALGAVVLAGGVFLGISLLRNMVGGDEPTLQPTLAATQEVAPGAVPTLPPEPTATSAPGAVPTIDVSSPRGTVLIGDRFLAGALTEIEPPGDGMQYQAWLIGTEVEPLHLNPAAEVSFADGQLTIDYQHRVGDSLVVSYHTLALSVEPTGSGALIEDHVRYRGRLSPELVDQLELYDQVHRGDPLFSDLLGLLPRQATHFQSHANLAINEINASNLAGAKLHAEHTINIAEGSDGEFYADWDGSGVPENPAADDVGLFYYLQLVRAAAQGYGAAQRLAGRVDDLPDQVAAEADRLVDASIAVRDAARQVAGADVIAIVSDLGLAGELANANAVKSDIDALAATAEALELQFSFEIFAVGSGGG